MKFKTQIDEAQFKILKLDEIEVRKRVGLVSKKKDNKKSRIMKDRWRRDKNSLKKGIKKWNKSTKGKRFHKALGRFNALRETAGYQYYYMNDWEETSEEFRTLSMKQVNDSLLSLSSIETHLFLELQYYEPDPEALSEFLSIIDMFLQDAYEIKLALMETYTSGVIDLDNYILLNDIIQFFQDPKMYIYAKRELADLSNDSDTEEFREQVHTAENIDLTMAGNIIYDKLDKLFD